MNNVERSMYDALVDTDVTVKDVILRTSILYLDIAPSKIALAKIEGRLIGEMDGQ